MKIDIVSDVVCPWCIVGFKQLEQALKQLNVDAEIHWQPFELNPGMPDEGQNMGEHIIEKYRITPEQSDANRENLKKVGSSLGFDFNFTPQSRMANTFKAHQLLHWAGLKSHEKEHELKLALFDAHFTDQRNINDNNILVAAALSVELDVEEAIKVLQDEPYADDVRERQKFWVDQGVSGVPAMVFDDKYLVTGAQGVENFVSVIQEVLAAE